MQCMRLISDMPNLMAFNVEEVELEFLEGSHANYLDALFAHKTLKTVEILNIRYSETVDSFCDALESVFNQEHEPVSIQNFYLGSTLFNEDSELMNGIPEDMKRIYEIIKEGNTHFSFSIEATGLVFSDIQVLAKNIADLSNTFGSIMSVSF